jgi:hypothetical protein
MGLGAAIASHGLRDRSLAPLALTRAPQTGVWRSRLQLLAPDPRIGQAPLRAAGLKDDRHHRREHRSDPDRGCGAQAPGARPRPRVARPRATYVRASHLGLPFAADAGRPSARLGSDPGEVARLGVAPPSRPGRNRRNPGRPAIPHHADRRCNSRAGAGFSSPLRLLEETEIGLAMKLLLADHEDVVRSPPHWIEPRPRLRIPPSRSRVQNVWREVPRPTYSTDNAAGAAVNP